MFSESDFNFLGALFIVYCIHGIMKIRGHRQQIKERNARQAIEDAAKIERRIQELKRKSDKP